MDKKEFIAKTIAELSNCPAREQVEIFDDIKNGLLCIRKEMYEKNMENIKEMNLHNEIIQAGNNLICGNGDLKAPY